MARAAFAGRRSPDLLASLWILLLLAGRRGGRPPRGGATREDLEAGTQGRAGLAASAGAGDEDGCGKTVVLEREGARRARSSAEVPLLAADGLCGDLQGRRCPRAVARWWSSVFVFYAGDVAGASACSVPLRRTSVLRFRTSSLYVVL